MKILIVDDDQETCNVLEQYLKLRGYSATSVYDGKSGITEMKRNHYDRVVLDMSMPRSSGIDVLNEIKDHENEPEKIVVYTAVPFSKDEENIIKEKGAYALLSKKIGLVELTNYLV
ncbi:MAG: response regulator [Nitrosopumilus sp.]